MLSLDKGSDDNLNEFSKIQKVNIENLKDNVLGDSNINSLQNKFIFVQAVIRGFDIFLISELKLDNFFPNNQCKTDFIKFFGLIETYRWGLILCINEKM